MSKNDDAQKGKPENGDKHKGDQALTLKIATPKGSFTATFDKNAKVSDVIEAAIDKKGLTGSASDFEVFHGEQELTPVNRPLVSFGLKDGNELLVTAAGEGV